jgi:hypothetical protein
MGSLQISEEERLRRSERMKQLHAEGRAGAEYGKLGGRPRKKRASEYAAEKAAEKGKEIWERLISIVESDNDKTALDAIKHIYALEEQERKVEVEEEVRYEQLKHADLAELVIANLFELVRTGQVDLGEIIDGEVIEERQAIGPGESD